MNKYSLLGVGLRLLGVMYFINFLGSLLSLLLFLLIPDLRNFIFNTYGMSSTSLLNSFYVSKFLDVFYNLLVSSILFVFTRKIINVVKFENEKLSETVSKKTIVEIVLVFNGIALMILAQRMVIVSVINFLPLLTTDFFERGIPNNALPHVFTSGFALVYFIFGFLIMRFSSLIAEFIAKMIPEKYWK